MNITVVGRHLDVTDGMRSHVEDKVSKLEKILHPITGVHVTLSVQKKYVHVAEIVLQARQETVKGLADSEDMYLSIDAAAEKVSQHLKKLRDKSKDHKGRSLKEEALELTEMSEKQREVLLDQIDFITVDVQTMDIEDAVRQINALEKNMLVFRRTDTHAVSVITKTNNDRYEVIALEQS